ncbi:hypothetical protein I6B53_00715 [Schaalia sp. 19OD2882]|uniref:histidine kinase n=1 Tax=Schaalia sp. 19OD2882 TaxID=2794089 RepID=UPI001C1EFCDB|nr:histidine kinase [Schaalia sp. 19OD2882]QWW19698.1 hypothetical protein I6B53_00715 [Schaalia sp. 19OD2882]
MSGTHFPPSLEDSLPRRRTTVTSRSESLRRTRKEPKGPSRLVSLAWASSFLFMLLASAVTATSAGLDERWAVALLVEIIFFAAVYITSWLVNDTAPRYESGTGTFVLTSLLMLVLQVAAVFTHAQLDSAGGIAWLCYLAATSALLSPKRLTLPSIAVVVTIAAVETMVVPAAGFLPLLGVTMTGILTLLARNRMDLEVQRGLDDQHRLALTRERERTQANADLHDALWQDLTSIVAHSDLACRLLEADQGPQARQHMEEVLSISRSAHDEIRRVVSATRTAIPDSELESARSLLSASGVRLDLIRLGDPTPGTAATMSARVIREACANAVAHSSPSHVQVTLRSDGVSVTNDGYSEPLRPHYDRASAGALAKIREKLGYRGSLTWGPDGDHWTVDLEVDE